MSICLKALTGFPEMLERNPGLEKKIDSLETLTDSQKEVIAEMVDTAYACGYHHCLSDLTTAALEFAAAQASLEKD